MRELKKINFYYMVTIKMSNDRGCCQDYTLDNFIETVRVYYK